MNTIASSTKHSSTNHSSSNAEAHHVPFSIRLLRRAKPVVVGLLRSPLHGALSRDVLLMTWTGRRSGRTYTLPLSYVAHGDAFYLCTRPEGSDWWKNLRGGGEVELRMLGKKLLATATVLDPASAEALDGLRAFVSRNPRTGVMLYKVAPGPNEADLRREVQHSVVVKLSPSAAKGQAAAAEKK